MRDLPVYQDLYKNSSGPDELNRQSDGLERLAYSLKEVAEMLGISEGHLRNENRRGKLVLVHSGRLTRILAEDLQRYLAGLPRKTGNVRTNRSARTKRSINRKNTSEERKRYEDL